MDLFVPPVPSFDVFDETWGSCSTEFLKLKPKLLLRTTSPYELAINKKVRHPFAYFTKRNVVSIHT